MNENMQKFCYATELKTVSLEIEKNYAQLLLMNFTVILALQALPNNTNTDPLASENRLVTHGNYQSHL